jgi:periplasmic copper chaperone A
MRPHPLATQFLVVGASVLLLTEAALAHVGLEIREATAGSYYHATFNVPHGCAGSATTAITVEVPPEIVTAKPQPKPGWTLRITHEKLPQPVTVEGNQLTERVKEVSWSGGKLPDQEFDSFTMMVHLPDHAGPLYFPTVQHCESGETRWTDMPPAGKTSRDVPHPPPVVTLVGRSQGR